MSSYPRQLQKQKSQLTSVIRTMKIMEMPAITPVHLPAKTDTFQLLFPINYFPITLLSQQENLAAYRTALN